MSDTTRLPTIHKCLVSQLEELMSSANELKRVYDRLPLTKIGETPSGHDAYCQSLINTSQLVTQAKFLIEKANQDARRFNLGTGVTSKKRKEKMSLIAELLKGDEKSQADLSAPIKLTNPTDMVYNAVNPEQQKNQNEVVQLIPAEEETFDANVGNFNGFTCSMLSKDCGAYFISFDASQQALVRGAKTKNGKSLVVKVANPEINFEEANKIVLSVASPQTSHDHFVYYFDKVILITKNKILECYVPTAESKTPVYPQGLIDMNKPAGLQKSEIANNIESTERIQTCNALIAILNKDRKIVQLVNPDKLTQKAVLSTYNEVRVFSLYAINSEKRQGECILFVSEKDGSLYHLISSQTLKAEKQGKLLQAAGLLDVFYAGKKLYVLRFETGKLFVDAFPIDAGEANSPAVKVGTPVKIAEFAVDAKLADAEVRLGIVGEQNNEAEATIMVFVGKELLKYSCKDKKLESLILFNQDFMINAIIPQIDATGLISFMQTSTIRKGKNFDTHVISLRFSHMDHAIFLEEENDFIPDEEGMEEY